MLGGLNRDKHTRFIFNECVRARAQTTESPGGSTDVIEMPKIR